MATSGIKKFLDQTGVSTLWARILKEIDKKASKNDFNLLQNRVKDIEEGVILYGGSATDVIEEELNNG